MKVWMLLLILMTSSAIASEFTYIKLNPEFEEYLTQPKSKSNLIGGLSKTSQKSSAPSSNVNMRNKMASVLLGSSLNTKSGFNNPIPTDGEESLLFEEIRRQLDLSHSNIGAEHVRNINHLNLQFDLGSSNISGFSWQQPFGVVQVMAERQVTPPNIISDRWLVTDTFTIEIEASALLEKLSDSGLSNMGPAEIGAFAGITFKRSYSYWHFANSYQEGLQSDFSKLFLPFIKFNKRGMETMHENEIMRREDVWTARAGGLITTPPLYNISFGAGVLAQYDYLNTTSIEKKSGPEGRFQVGVENKNTATLGVTLGLQLDFFNFLKISLLNYDLNYEYSSGKELTLGFSADQWNHIKEDSEKRPEFESILNGFGSVKKLEPYVVRLDEHSSEGKEQRGSIFLWGKLQKANTEQIRTIKDGVVRVFYKNYSENIKVVQNFFSRIFSALVYKLIKIPMGTRNASIYSRKITIEYEATHPQATNPKIVRLDSTDQFSFVLTQYYSSARTDRWIDRKYKNDLIWFVDNFTTLPKTYKTDIRSELLRGPMEIHSNLRVEKAGLHYLLENSEDHVFGYIAEVCKSQKIKDWIKENIRNKMLKKSQKGKEKCVKDIGLKFLSFKNDYLENFFKPSLKKFKDFLSQYYKKSGNITALQNLFGVDNTFINGKLTSSTRLGNNFQTNFSAGQFRGLGVIDNYKREQGSRAPASIVSE